MAWLRSVIDAVRRFFGDKKSESEPIVDLIPELPKEPPFTPEDAKINIIFYSEAVVKNLEVLSFNAYFSIATPLAKLIESETGIFWMIPVIQSAHESRSGNSILARKALNLFGIKNSASWKALGGPVMTIPSIEDPDMTGKKTPIEWRVYGSWNDSFKNWEELMHKPAYAEALPLMKEGESRIEEAFTVLGSVYAWDKSYAESLVRIYRSVKGGV